MPYFKKDTALPPFLPLPRFIVAGEYSINAKLLYGLLLSRTMLSQKSGWVSEDGNVYVVYPIRELAEDLNRSEKTVKNALNELENAGLLSRVRQGLRLQHYIRTRRMFMNMDSVLSDIMETANEAQSSPDDYIASDGLKYCGKCHTPKEAFFPEGSHFGSSDRYPILCKCAAEKEARKKAQQQETERQERISQLRLEAFQDIPAFDWRFENTTVMTPQLAKTKSYVDNWETFRSDGIGLLLFGDVGTGKSYAAGCIANALIEKSVAVRFSAVSDIVNRMQGTFGDDRENFMKQLMRPELLILDDLGAERNTSFGKECVFDVVNRRLLSGKPMIVTTNITLSAMKTATDLGDRRIYDRILEVCVPVQFKGQNFREINRKANMQKAIEVLGG